MSNHDIGPPTPAPAPVQISELFVSVQGEGRAMGVPMVFVRTAHCNIECIWCDTPQRKIGQPMTLIELDDYVLASGLKDICFTGGEPMLQLRKLAPWLEVLAGNEYRLHLETNGTIHPGAYTDLLGLFDVITVSPKLPSAQHPDPTSALERKAVWDEGPFVNWCLYATENSAVSFKYVLEDEDAEWAALTRQLAYMRADTEVLVQPQTYQQDAYKRFGKRIANHIATGWPASGFPRVRYIPRFHELMWGDAPGR